MDQQLNWEGGFLYQFLTISCISFFGKSPIPQHDSLRILFNPLSVS